MPTISIHAPREGSDLVVLVIMVIDKYFNPRSPRGERRFHYLFSLLSFKFQSTLPARGATALTIEILPKILFQSTLPARGATISFYSSDEDHHISIHAPREGSDYERANKQHRRTYFNPRSPRGERQRRTTPIIIISNFNPRSPRGERLIFVYNSTA